MTHFKKITGKIIRIINSTTVIINLGYDNNISIDTIFKIIAPPEEIYDPETKDLLGTVQVVKSKLKAQTVHQKFTIATTKWTDNRIYITTAPSGSYIDNGELNVIDSDLEPWKANTVIPVRKGDQVECEVTVQDK